MSLDSLGPCSTGIGLPLCSCDRCKAESLLLAVCRAARDLLRGSPPLDPASGILLGMRFDDRSERVAFQTWAELARMLSADQVRMIRAAVRTLPTGDVLFAVQVSERETATLVGSLNPAELLKGDTDA